MYSPVHHMDLCLPHMPCACYEKTNHKNATEGRHRDHNGHQHSNSNAVAGVLVEL